MTTETSGGRQRSAKTRYRIERAKGAAERSRIFSYLVWTFVQRIDRLRRDLYGDLDLASIVEAIGLYNTEYLFRDAKWVEEYSSLSKVVGVSPQRGANALSISQATGIARETARRKIKKLIALGVITEVRRGEYVLTPGYLQRVATSERLDQVIADTLRLVNDGLDHGIYDCSVLSE